MTSSTVEVIASGHVQLIDPYSLKTVKEPEYQ